MNKFILVLVFLTIFNFFATVMVSGEDSQGENKKLILKLTKIKFFQRYWNVQSVNLASPKWHRKVLTKNFFKSF